MSQAAKPNKTMVINQLNRNDTGEIKPPKDVMAQRGPRTSFKGTISKVPNKPITTADQIAVLKLAISTPSGKEDTNNKIRALTGHCNNQPRGPMLNRCLGKAA